MIVSIDPSKVIFERKVQGMCKLAYKKHPQGCPNYGAERSLAGINTDLRSRVIRECPPNLPLIDKVFDFSKELFMVYTTYPVGKDAEERRLTRPKMKTPGQWYNFRYWQNRARNKLYREMESFLENHPGTIVDLCPEAHGTNLDETMKNIGINLEWGAWPPEHKIENERYQIAMGGYPSI
ncbi:hypothetical protein H8D91_02155 [archaeon]|nr:hypothetical protein [archaeon]